MITENVSTLKIHKLTKAQYERERNAGNLDETALYLTPDEEIDLSSYATKEDVDNLFADVATEEYINSILPEITEADEGKVLMVVNGKLQFVDMNITIDENGVVSV